MNLRQIDFFIALAQTQHFTRAAERCHTVQSALSHQIAKLEEEFSTRLFDRSSRNVVLTQAGRTFLQYAQKVSITTQRLRDEMAAATGEIRGTLAIGSIFTLTVIDLPVHLTNFHRQHPHVAIRIVSGASAFLLAQVQAQILDIAFVGLWAGEVIESDSIKMKVNLLCEEPLVAIVHPKHSLANSDQITLAQLAGDVMVDYLYNSKARIQTDQAFQEQGLSRYVGFEVDHIDWQIQLVSQGIAVALIPQSAMNALSGVTPLKIVNAPKRRVYCISNPNPTPAVAAFQTLIKAASIDSHL